MPAPPGAEVMNTRPLPHLATFAAAAERGSFTAAARDLGVSQAAVSQQVQALERLLGLPLFRPPRRRARPGWPDEGDGGPARGSAARSAGGRVRAAPLLRKGAGAGGAVARRAARRPGTRE